MNKDKIRDTLESLRKEGVSSRTLRQFTETLKAEGYEPFVVPKSGMLVEYRDIYSESPCRFLYRNIGGKLHYINVDKEGAYHHWSQWDHDMWDHHIIREIFPTKS